MADPLDTAAARADSIEGGPYVVYLSDARRIRDQAVDAVLLKLSNTITKREVDLEAFPDTELCRLALAAVLEEINALRRQPASQRSLTPMAATWPPPDAYLVDDDGDWIVVRGHVDIPTFKTAAEAAADLTDWYITENVDRDGIQHAYAIFLNNGSTDYRYETSDVDPWEPVTIWGAGNLNGADGPPPPEMIRKKADSDDRIPPYLAARLEYEPMPAPAQGWPAWAAEHLGDPSAIGDTPEQETWDPDGSGDTHYGVEVDGYPLPPIT